jgi:hypothetical protein
VSIEVPTRRTRKQKAQIINRRGGASPGNRTKTRKDNRSEQVRGKRKVWFSARESVDNRGNDKGAPTNLSWFRSPLMKAERLRCAATRG